MVEIVLYYFPITVALNVKAKYWSYCLTYKFKKDIMQSIRKECRKFTFTSNIFWNLVGGSFLVRFSDSPIRFENVLSYVLLVRTQQNFS